MVILALKKKKANKLWFFGYKLFISIDVKESIIKLENDKQIF
jgi:hypothetical protein